MPYNLILQCSKTSSGPEPNSCPALQHTEVGHEMTSTITPMTNMSNTRTTFSQTILDLTDQKRNIRNLICCSPCS